jgi:hypothetical protein
MQGFNMTPSLWEKIAKAVNRGLIKKEVDPNDPLRSKAAKDIVSKFGLDLMRDFPELSTHVPPQWLAKGVNQMIKVIHLTRKAKHSKKFRSRNPVAKTTVSPATSIAGPSTAPPFNAELTLTSSHPEAKVPDTLAAPIAHAQDLTRLPARDEKAALSKVANDEPAGGSLFNPPNARFKTPDKSPDLGGSRSKRDAVLTPDTTEKPTTPARASLSSCEVHPDLKKMQLCAIAYDEKDSSFINLGELLLKSHIGQPAAVYTSLDDITDQDWEYYHDIYLPTDLDRGFLSGMDKLYFDSVGAGLVRIKNAASWRAAMVAMQEAGAAQFKFIVERKVKGKFVSSSAPNGGL